MDKEEYKKFRSAFEKMLKESNEDTFPSEGCASWYSRAIENVNKTLDKLWKLIEEIEFYWLDK